MSVIGGSFEIKHHTVSSNLKTLKDSLLFFGLNYVENANCKRETKISSFYAMYSNVKIDLKVSPTTLTDHCALFFDSPKPKLNHLEKEDDDDRMTKLWTKLIAANAIISLEFYM